MIIDAYERAIQEWLISDDAGQREILLHLQNLNNELTKGRRSWLARIRHFPIRGLYLYGPVGVGKTFLMDLFYKNTPETRKSRFHFLEFMQLVDAELRKRQGQKDPLLRFAKDFAKKTRLLCLDEFMVKDIAHAMILGELFHALFSRNVVMVLTSNTPPDDLYQNGLQRERFLPAIALIKKQCKVLSFGKNNDYRLGRAPLLNAYLTPLNEETRNLMLTQFLSVAIEPAPGGNILVQTREIEVLHLAKNTIWFQFDILCNLPRSQLDYLEIASRFNTIFISDIPQFRENDTVYALLFIALVDVLYDRGVRLIVSAEVPLEELYLEGEALQQFRRTYSRLQEMRSVDYLLRHENYRN